jgi:uncharacterized protein
MNRMSRHPARDGLLRASLLGAALVVLLGGCAGGGLGIGSSAENRAERLADDGRHADAAGAYIGLAASASDTERDRLTLLAVEQWLDAGDVARARNAFASVAKPASGELRWLWDSDSAAFALFAGNADAALEILEPMSREPLSRRRRVSVEALRADAWLQKQDPIRAIELMTQREAWLDDRRSIENNRWRLWQGLLTCDPQVLRSAAGTATDREVKAWLTLSALAASTGRQGIGWVNGAVRWQQANPHHPALLIADRLQLPDELSMDYPRNIALLLPLSGRTAPAGLAIQNGFMGAYFSTSAALEEKQTVRVYDVNAEGGASAAYSAAVADGAEFVIGPLLRDSVTALANDILVPVPVLTLNYLPDDVLAPPGLYQFALAPEDEAASAADRAMADGHSRAVALVPNNEWGRRVLASFSNEFRALGGTVLDYRAYTPGMQDFSNTIEDLMGLTGSVNRYQRLRANIGGPLQYDPRRRQDSDLIFLAADAPAGRLLKAQLKFHYSGDLPVYSTSSIYAMDGRPNTDLNGVMFADTPWIIAPQNWIQQLPALYDKYWPEERRLGRLHAMGYDAYHLIAALFEAHTESMPEIDGATGRLYLDRDGRVHRRLAWAQFQHGEPVALPDTEPPTEGPIRDISGEPEEQAPDSDDTWYEETPKQ